VFKVFFPHKIKLQRKYQNYVNCIKVMLIFNFHEISASKLLKENIVCNLVKSKVQNKIAEIYREKSLREMTYTYKYIKKRKCEICSSN